MGNPLLEMRVSVVGFYVVTVSQRAAISPYSTVFLSCTSACKMSQIFKSNVISHQSLEPKCPCFVTFGIDR